MTMLTSLLILSAAFALGDATELCPLVINWCLYPTLKYLGANLSSVHSSEEDEFLQALVLVKTVGFPPTWIGGFYSVKDRRWFWSDGSDFDHQNWAKGRPDAGAREACIHINFGGQKRWNNALCGRSLPSVCSLRLLPLRQTIH
ncbi:ladderlectin-like [Salmo salar]|uniref:Ladderlectin-like n=1 Tax=Salmo salar TaxID=8030 RepID=A0ABM3DCN8_SALSA|nr:ladderlectin-like [Salmo salar]XP_045556573.1 ladderlectin-like [Salmo salar]|eukprot:XP_014068878.1 PREDICTED: ladderlectin-like [Salmo salar]